ncbi:hypothetical protein Tco_0736876 [Tanacetum coccineum]
MSEKQLIDGEINDITNDLSYKRFRGEKIDDEYERDCEIKIKQLLQDYSGLDIEMRKKERVLNGRKVSSGCFTHNIRKQNFDPGIFYEVQSERLLSWDEFSISFIHDPLCPVFDLLLPFSSENEDKVFNPGDSSGDKVRKAKRTTEISQSSGPIPLVTDETVIKEWEDRMERAATTASSLEAKQDSVLVYAARHSLAAIRHKLMLPGIISYCWFWATAKAKTVNGERYIQSLVDKKKVIITEKSVRSDLMLEDAEGTKCFSGRITPLFQTMMVQAPEDMGEDSAAPTDSYSTPIITQPSSSKPQKKKSKMKQRKDSGLTEPISNEATNEESISTPSCDPPQSGEDRLQLTELMSLCTKLQKQVLDLEEAKTAQAKEIASLKKRVKQLEKRKKSRTPRLKRLRKVGSASRVESSNDVSLGAHEDASKQGRKIADLDADAEVTLIDETQERYDEEMLFDVQDDLQGEEVVVEKEVSDVDPVTTAGEVVTTVSAITTVEELTLA